MLLKYTPMQLDPRLDDAGKPVKDDSGKEAEGPFLPDLFEGYVEIRMPSYPERIRFPKEIGVADLLGDEVEQKNKLKKSLDQIEVMARASEKAKEFIQAVDLKYRPDNKHLKNADDLYFMPEAGPLIMGLCSKFITGFASKKI